MPSGSDLFRIDPNRPLPGGHQIVGVNLKRPDLEQRLRHVLETRRAINFAFHVPNYRPTTDPDEMARRQQLEQDRLHHHVSTDEAESGAKHIIESFESEFGDQFYYLLVLVSDDLSGAPGSHSARIFPFEDPPDLSMMEQFPYVVMQGLNASQALEAVEIMRENRNVDMFSVQTYRQRSRIVQLPLHKVKRGKDKAINDVLSELGIKHKKNVSTIELVSRMIKKGKRDFGDLPIDLLIQAIPYVLDVRGRKLVHGKGRNVSIVFDNGNYGRAPERGSR